MKKNFLQALVIGCLFFVHGALYAGVEQAEPSCEDVLFSGITGEESLASIMQGLILPCIAADIPVKMLISSNGGGMGDAISIYDAIKMYNKKNILTTIAIGNVGSATLLIYLSGDKREIAENGKIFLHPVVASLSAGEMSLSDLRLRTDLLSGDIENYVKIIAGQTNLPPEKIRTLMENGTVIGAEEAVKYGFAHKIVDRNEDKK